MAHYDEIFAFNPPTEGRMTMPYRLNGGATRRGRRRRRSNPWVYRSAPTVKVPVLAARAYGRLKRKRGGKVPKGVRFISTKRYKQVGAATAKRAAVRSALPMFLRAQTGRFKGLARTARIASARARMGKSSRSTKARRRFFKTGRKTKGKKRKTVSKSKKRSAAARKAARTRARNKAARSARARRAAAKRGRKGGRRTKATTRRRRGGRRVRRTKIRATLVRIPGKRGRRGRLQFQVPKSKRAAFRRLRGRRWAKQRIRFNPGDTPRSFLGMVKSAFSFETVKVLGVGLVGLSLGAGVSEMAGRAFLKGQSPDDHKAGNLLVGIGAGVVVTSGVSYLISKRYSNAGKIFFWFGLAGVAARAIATAFPGKTGLDMPRTAQEASVLAGKLAAQETQGLFAQAQQAMQNARLPGTKDWLGPQVEGYAQVEQGSRDVEGYLDLVNTGSGGGAGADGGHPMVGHGQSW